MLIRNLCIGAPALTMTVSREGDLLFIQAAQVSKKEATHIAGMGRSFMPGSSGFIPSGSADCRNRGAHSYRVSHRLRCRAPWTLASDTVWIATHRFAAPFLVGGGLLGAAGAALGIPPQWCFVVLVASFFAPVVYSLWLSNRLEKSAEPEDRE
jgi:hypothetical protein